MLQNLTELDVSDNSIEHLDLSAIPTLRRVDCSRNKICELILNGTALTTVTAANNSKYFFHIFIRMCNMRNALYATIPNHEKMISCEKKNSSYDF